MSDLISRADAIEAVCGDCTIENRYEDDGYDRTAWITAPDCEDIDVLAWMPLPKPYREDGEEE